MSIQEIRDTKFEVIEDIPAVMEIGAKKGDVLTVDNHGGVAVSTWTLLKNGKKVCNLATEYGRNNCKIIV
ncbi:hypothetical protein [Sporosalibacterium faouarense]|uniref:hypothetical protein n=1 Tax=Sporosalibacterium faouarense TaxID=516123 RepID=UPI00192A8AF9|nr:hypothetical protein [Sporosalibacterium faouarense]